MYLLSIEFGLGYKKNAKCQRKELLFLRYIVKDLFP